MSIPLSSILPVRSPRLWSAAVLVCASSQSIAARAQDAATRVLPPSRAADLAALTETIAVTGYEGHLADLLERELAPWHPTRDTMGNLTVTLGSGAPHRLLATPVDEPGYIVSHVTPEGYLRVQRLPQGGGAYGLPPHYNELNNAQPMLVETASGKLLPAIAAGLSIHLEPGRKSPPDPDDLDNFYLDAGASSAAEIQAAGIENLSPIAAERHLLVVGQTDWSSTAIGDRFGAVALLQVLRSINPAKLQGATTFAFVTEQWSGGRGLSRILVAEHPDELLYIGRALAPTQPQASVRSLDAADISAIKTCATAALGTGVCLAGASPDTMQPTSLGGSLRQILPTLQIADAAPFLPPGYGPPVDLPARTAHLAIPLRWPLTAAETLDETDLDQFTSLLRAYVSREARTPPSPVPARASRPSLPPPPRPTASPDLDALLRDLILTYGVSERETLTREAVQRLLPPWAHATTDPGGNLILRFGNAPASPTPHGILVVAHTDELGFRVEAINPDGTLALANKGGGSPAFFWGHPALVHTSSGDHEAVLSLPDNYNTPGFHFPADFRVPATLFLGAHTPADVQALGIHVGDPITIPKDYRRLLNRRVSARSLDDRVGCAAMVRAVWSLGPDFHRDVTFVWSTREELGLLGAGEFALESAKAGQTPRTVFAIDTFVSSDSPLESSRFADAELGKGFVIRAVDNSNIAPWEDVRRLRQLASKSSIPFQFGVTGGGNDGATFVRYGATDVALGWPLRYSHSPGEVIDLRDLDALASITEQISRSW